MSDDQEVVDLDSEPTIDIDILADAVEEHDDELAADLRTYTDKQDAQIQNLQDTVEDQAEEIVSLEEEVDELQSKLKRKQADFQNYKKRQQREQERIQTRVTKELIDRFLSVRDDLERAIEADHDDIDDIREGIRMTLQSFDRVLDAEDVTEINPDAGEDTDPHRHEVMMRVDADQPAGTVVDVYQPGYQLSEDDIIRPAQVTVSTGEPDDSSDESGK